MLLEDARIGEMVVNPVDHSLVGIRHVNGIATLVHIPPPYDKWNQVYVFPYESVPYDLDISPDGKLLSASMSEVNADQFVRVWELDKALRGELTLVSEFRFGQSIPESFVVLEGRPLSVRQQLLHGRVEHLPLRGGDRRGRRRHERRDRLLPAGAARRRQARRPVVHGRGLRADDHRSARHRRRERDHVPGCRSRGEVSDREDLAGAAAQRRRRGEAHHRAGALSSAAQHVARERLSGAAGLQELGRDRLSVQFRGSALVRQAGDHGGVHAHDEPPRERARTRRHLRQLPGLARCRVVEPIRFLRPVRSHQAEPQGLCGEARLRLAPDLR